MSTLTSEPNTAWAASPTGLQWSIGHGPFEATVVEVGGGLRTVTRDGQDVVAGYRLDEHCQSGRGQQLMPWPNRIRGGRYPWAGKEHQLPITEVSRGNASHGLVRWAPWELIEHEADSVTVGYRLHPQPGWDHHLDLRTTYVLDDSGLVITAAARNLGQVAAPFGYGAHPYLSIGRTPLDEVRLVVPAEERAEVDEQQIPVGRGPVEGTPLDFRAERAVGALRLDTAYTRISRDDDGMWRCHVRTPDAGDLVLWADESFPWVQVFTGAAAEHKGLPGIAVEPMTCPPDAFNSRESLVTLEPGAEWTGTWGISVGISVGSTEG